MYSEWCNIAHYQVHAVRHIMHIEWCNIAHYQGHSVRHIMHSEWCNVANYQGHSVRHIMHGEWCNIAHYQGYTVQDRCCNVTYSIYVLVATQLANVKRKRWTELQGTLLLLSVLPGTGTAGYRINKAVSL